MRIAITGASGNVGTGLLRALSADTEDHDIVGICRRPPISAPPYDRVTWHPIDLGADTAHDQLRTAFDKADAVVHLAWAFQPVRDGEQLHRTNYKGTRAVLDAAHSAGVTHLVHGSSIGAYAPGATEPVDETWATTGIPTSRYGTGKAEAERMVERFTAEHPEITVSSVRPTLVTQSGAAASFRALFFDPIVPEWLLGLLSSGRFPVLPLPAHFRVQLVHADDLGDAIVRILRRRAPGAFNIAADTVTIEDLAAVAESRALPVPSRLLRGLVAVLWRMRLLRLSPGWYDVGTESPLVETTRARETLGWVPQRTSSDAARDQLRGLAGTEALPSPALRRDRFLTEPYRRFGRS
ncbi:NAD-dependent epimerase/dehydratase family protein [Amycolatopsis sp. QT-25]|uniref:NAD-dependent epimerase/dehydratase family protein n=1 Tax=Amycolatopsis sp. QT-25 TaxID=3034022 RepID=UPI0023ECC2FB|nr:NAD-dependent epimerase/dehydratase family protein [Amycolatopsis sp. QT-25]WET76825.1 NAD-dependent epimerase/dehydratase family protein [Amycolatopsis sp. QT-25]